jgi:hypothetical protein
MAPSPNPMVDQAILLVLMLWGDGMKEAQDCFVNRRLGVRFLSPAPQLRQCLPPGCYQAKDELRKLFGKTPSQRTPKARNA